MIHATCKKIANSFEPVASTTCLCVRLSHSISIRRLQMQHSWCEFEEFFSLLRCFCSFFFPATLPTLSSSRNIQSGVTTTRIRTGAIFLVVGNMTSRFLHATGYNRTSKQARRVNIRQMRFHETFSKLCYIMRCLFINSTLQEFALIYIKSKKI